MGEGASHAAVCCESGSEAFTDQASTRNFVHGTAEREVERQRERGSSREPTIKLNPKP